MVVGHCRERKGTFAMIGAPGLASSKTRWSRNRNAAASPWMTSRRCARWGFSRPTTASNSSMESLSKCRQWDRRMPGIVNHVAKILILRLGEDADVRVQSSVLLSRYTQPEPDLAVVRPDRDRYLQRHPDPQDILIAIEVADSSLTYDREEKMPRYAAAGVPEAWLVNVRARTITVYTDPTTTGYRTTRTLEWTEELAATAVDDLRPHVRGNPAERVFPRS